MKNLHSEKTLLGYLSLSISWFVMLFLKQTYDVKRVMFALTWDQMTKHIAWQIITSSITQTSDVKIDVVTCETGSADEMRHARKGDTIPLRRYEAFHLTHVNKRKQIIASYADQANKICSCCLSSVTKVKFVYLRKKR